MVRQPGIFRWRENQYEEALLAEGAKAGLLFDKCIYRIADKI